MNDSTPLPGEELYNRIQQFITQYIKNLAEKCANMKQKKLLKYYCKQYERYRLSSQELDNICKQLNGIWAQHPKERSKEFKDMIRVSLDIWRDCEELNKRVSDYKY